MKPIEFKHHNVIYAKDQKEYRNLPALKLDSPQGEVISCWKLSFFERLKVLFTGKVWNSQFTFNKALAPTALSVNRKVVFSVSTDKLSMVEKLIIFWKSK